MPETCHIHTDRDDRRNILTLRLIGDMPGHEAVDRLIAIYRQTEQIWAWRRLLDLRKYHGQIDYHDFEHLAAQWAHLTQALDYTGRVAVVSRRPYDRARVATVSHLFPYDDMKAFQATYAALDWLDERLPGHD
ncbi:hypothetical protein [Asticcacaulis sp. EMRT-3]|uniref:hypothetical protein n=1 Tax=Asticcacaulis sp. EMRT-3 TaxID=3040349 RepID=UPI0024AE9AD0|nr:hypothetical protein [Asticcacaulis sp. EMRT-3]MDI7775691.1 hypothetical protein [Asticcacaulis sp. EMRT-3]